MIYAVKANLIAEQATAFLRSLGDGSIARQRPDGGEIVAAMERARIQDDGSVCWTETCFCAAPLEHERETQLDRYFSDIEVERVDAHQAFEGTSLMAHLAAAAAGPG